VAIDMDNMLAGFSSQVITGTAGELDPGAGAIGSTVLAACVLRAEDVLDVGFVVTEAVTDDTTVQIGKAGTITADPDYFVTYNLTSASAVGTVFRTSDGTLSWTSLADVESERSCPLGTTITIEAGASGLTGKIVPFVIMRPQGPLDPIA